MATFTITTPVNIDSLTAKTGGDIYNINGGALTIDQHSRFGLNNGNAAATTATSMGSITLSATLGGSCNIDGRYIRLINFNTGTGTIPALNSLVTQGSASGKLMCVYSSLTAAPLVNGAAMPVTGWIMIKAWNSVEFATGALTLSGTTATSLGVSTVGFLEIFGDDLSTVNANRLGTFNITGEWYSLGTTNALATQTFQIPNNGTLKHIAGVYIEKTVGSNNYEFYPNAGTTITTTTVVATGTEATRGKVCWINNAGLVSVGNSGGTGLNGFVPVTGLKVVIGNVFLCCCTAAARNVEVIPSATIATRYDFTTTGGGVVNIDKCNSAWYLSFAQAYSVQLTNVGTIDGLLLSECATPINWTRVGVGNKPTTALLMSALTMSLCFAGGTLTDCVWARVSQATASQHTNTLTDISGFTFIRDTIRCNTIRANATTYSIFGTRVSNCTWTNPTIIQGSAFFVQSDLINITNTIYCDAVVGTTVTTYAMYVWSLTSSCSNFTISGLTMPVINTQPYTALLGLAVAGTTVAGISNIKLRNIGTRAVPLSLGSANGTGLIYELGVAGGVADVKVQRVYCSNTRTGIMTCDNSSTRITEENVWGDYADAVDVMSALNLVRKGNGGTGALTAQVSVYGTHWRDGFTSTTAGRISILMNEPSSLTANQVTLSNGSAFTSAGGLYMPVIGHSVVFETPNFIIGHTAFTNTALVMGGGTATNYNYFYQIDKNDGAGWSVETATLTATTLGTSLSGVTGIDASKGFKLRIRITTATTNTTAITSVYLTTVSTTAAQDFQYPLDVITLTLTGLVSGSDVVILSAGTSINRTNIDNSIGFTVNYIYETVENVDIVVYKSGYIPFTIRNYTLSSTNSSLPIAQVIDRNYA